LNAEGEMFEGNVFVCSLQFFAVEQSKIAEQEEAAIFRKS
jgi:hypothetical protein